MAKMSKAQARKRMVECQNKILATMESGHLSASMQDALWKIRKQLINIEAKLK
jgi:hypothetical protein